MSEITSPSLVRLARAAGIESISTDAINELRSVIEYYLDNIVNTAVIYMEHSARQTLMSQDIQHAIEQKFGRKIYGKGKTDPCKLMSLDPLKSGNKRKKGSVAKREVDFYTKHSDCAFLAKTQIRRHIRNIVPEKRISIETVDTLRADLESYLIRLLKLSLKMAEHANRKTVKASDIKLAENKC